MNNNKVLIEALKEIVSPIEYMRSRLQEGETLNGVYAMQIANDPNHLKKIAKSALASYAEQVPPVIEEDAITAFQKRFVVERIPEYMQESFRFFSEGFKAAGGGQVTGKSAVWENIGPSTDPKESKVYNVKKNREGREIIGECMYDNILGEWNGDWDQWLDTSGKAGKLPEQQKGGEA